MSVVNILLAWLLLAPEPVGTTCQGKIARDRVVACALAASPEIEALEQGAEAAAARRLSARTILPSNPRVEVSAAGRRSVRTSDRDTNFYGTLSQEVEVAGQRGKRLAVVDATVAAERSRIDAGRRELAAEALRRYFEALAARDERVMIERIDRGMDRLAELAEASESAGLGSGLGTEIASTTVVKVRQRAIHAERRQAAAEALLGGLLGLDPAAPNLELIGELKPLAITAEVDVLVAKGLEARAELEVATAEREAQRRQGELYRRLRVPNPSLVVYGQRDGFFEQVLGGGVGLAIPLPSPLGHTYKGEIAESRARVRQADAELEALRRRIRGEVVTAYGALRAAEAELALFDVERLTRVEGYLRELTEEMAAGRVTIREGALLQLALLDLLANYIDVRREHCLASVELARAAGLLPEEIR